MPVTGESLSGDGDGISESVALACGEIDFVHQPQNARGGPGTGAEFGRDARKNRVN